MCDHNHMIQRFTLRIPPGYTMKLQKECGAKVRCSATTDTVSAPLILYPADGCWRPSITSLNMRIAAVLSALLSANAAVAAPSIELRREHLAARQQPRIV